MLPPSPPPFPMASPPTLFVTAQQVAPLQPATKAPRKPALQCTTCGRGKAAPSCGLCRQCCVKTADVCAVKSQVDKTALSAAPTRAVHVPHAHPAAPLTIRLPPSALPTVRQPVETSWAEDPNDLTTSFDDMDGRCTDAYIQYSGGPYDPLYDFDAEHAREYIAAAASPSPSAPTPSLASRASYNAPSGQTPSPTSNSAPTTIPASYSPASPTPPPPSQPRTTSVHHLPPPPSSVTPTEPPAPPTLSRPQRKRAAAASVPKPSPAPLPITLQLTDDWWGSRGGPSIAGIASPPTPTLSMRPPEAHRPLVEKREHEQFDFFYWLEPGTKAKGVLIDKCPRFPKYKLDDAAADYAPELFVGVGPRDKLDVYYPKYRTWMGAHRDVLLTVSTGSVVFVRCQNEGWDEVTLEKEMAMYTPAPDPNIVYELKAERKAVRDSYAKLRKLDKGGLHWVHEDEEDDKDERPSQSRKRTQSAAGLSLPPPTRLRLALNTITDDDDNDDILSPTSTCYPDSPTPTSELFSPISTYASLPPSPLSPPSLPPSPALRPATIRKSLKPPFADGMYVADVAAGFLRMKAAELQQMRHEERCLVVFGKSFKQSTYNDNRRKWENAPMEMRERYKKAGQTAAGLWASFTHELSLLPGLQADKDSI